MVCAAEAYADSAGVVFLLALTMLIAALTYPYSRGLFSLECANADMFIGVIAVTLLLTLGISAVKSYAAFGAAATMLVSGNVTQASE